MIVSGKKSSKHKKAHKYEQKRNNLCVDLDPSNIEERVLERGRVLFDVSWFTT